MRSSSASFSFSWRNLLNSARFVCATIVSSRWISGNRDTLTFFSCVNVSSRYRNSRLTLRISIISSTPRLAAYTAPDHDQARGSPSSPISATFERSTEPTRSAMSAVVGSCGAYVPTPTRAASDRKTRSTGKRMKSPWNSSSSRARAYGDSSPVISTPYVSRKRGRRLVGTRFSGDSCSGEPCNAYSAPSSVWLYSSSPRFSRITSDDLPPDGGPSSSSSRRPTSEPGSRRLEVVDDAIERRVDAEQLAGEQRLSASSPSAGATSCGCASRYPHSMS